MYVWLIGLFVALTPGILVTLPKKGSKVAVAATHALLFAVVVYLLRKYQYEGFQGFPGFPGLPDFATMQFNMDRMFYGPIVEAQLPLEDRAKMEYLKINYPDRHNEWLDQQIQILKAARLAELLELEEAEKRKLLVCR
jgi:hypothetical protein